MPSPPRIKKKSKIKSLLLPTSVVLPIPAGPPVLVGGPPTISLMGLAMKLGMAGLLKGLKKLAKTKVFKRLMAAAKKAKSRVFKNMKPGFLKCKILKAEPVDITSGEVVIEQQDFELHWPLPLKWTRRYSSHSTRMGLCGFGWDTPADSRLIVESDGAVLFYDGTAGCTLFPSLPDDGPVREFVDGGILTSVNGYLQVQLKSGLTYHFGVLDHRRTEYPVKRITDRCGNSLTFRASTNALLEIISNIGPRLEVVSQEGRIHKLILHHPLEEKRRTLVHYEYSEEGDLREVYDAIHNPYRFFYRNHCVTRHTNRNGLSFHYEFDLYTQEGRVVHTWGDGGLYDYQFKYDMDTGLVHITDSLGYATVVELNELGLPIREKDALGGVTQYEYDECGRTAVVTDPLGHSTEYHYDEFGNLVHLVRPDGVAVAMKYDAQHHLVELIDANGQRWRQEWTADGLLKRRISPLGNATAYEYDSRGGLLGVVLPGGSRTECRNDMFGNCIELIDPLGRRTGLGWDALGNLLTRTDALGRTAELHYDSASRLVKFVSVGGRSEEYGYDCEGFLTRYCDGEGRVTKLEYFGLGEISRRRQPDGHICEYEYDSEERLVAIINQRGECYRLRRDCLGRVVEETNYWGQKRYFEYDAAGRLTRLRNALGQTTEYKTDPLGRLVERKLPEGAVETFQFDPKGNLIGTANRHAKVERVFDAEGRLTKETINDFTIENTYDADGKRLRRSTSLGNTAEFHFDARGLATAVKINERAAIRREYDAVGLPLSETFGPELERRTEYDPDGLIIRQNLTAMESRVYDRSYQYDRRGELVGRLASPYGAERFLYDPMSRIRQHIDPAGCAREFLRDPAGDLLKPVGANRDGNGTGGYLWTRTSAYNGVTCIFDATGNTIERRDNRGLLRLEWDANNRLVRSHNPDGTKTDYGYDAQGRRVFKSTNGKRTMFGWDDDAVVADLNESEVREFVYLPDSFEPLAMIHRPVNPAAPRDLLPRGIVYHYHNEPNGAACDLTDADGEVVWSASYSALGGADLLRLARVDQRVRLQGQYLDQETNLAYNRHRYYDAATGSFISEDPLGHAAGDNTYAFAPNVQRWIDPLGLACHIQGIHEDTVVKGVHIDASNGVELSVRPNHTGGVTFVPVFSGERPSAVRAAIREAEEDLANPKFVTRLRDTADRATSFLVLLC